MITYVVIDKQTSKEVSTFDVLRNDGIITESYYEYNEEDDCFEDSNEWDYLFSLSPNGSLRIEGVDVSGGDFARRTYYVDEDRYKAVLTNGETK